MAKKIFNLIVSFLKWTILTIITFNLGIFIGEWLVDVCIADYIFRFIEAITFIK